MKEALTAYFDLLGFSSIIRNPDDSRQEQILQVLSNLADGAGDFEYKAVPVDGNFTDHIIKPAVSAFSDNIVFSFPTEGIEKVGFGPIIGYLADQAAAIFNNALNLRCLVRGGMALGQLHHEKRVLFGPALVDAYELESRLALMPRVLISVAASNKIKSHPYLRIDDDGFAYLDYIRAAYDRVPFGVSGHANWATNKRRWIEHVRSICAEQVEILEAAKNLSGLQKWSWFINRFNQFVAGLDFSITGE